MKPIYLHGLNGVRAIAATVVIIAHALPVISVQSMIGAKAVSIFFTLSGFLITYLLLQEKDLYQKIDIKKFYARRILRIWPLYFSALFLYALYNFFDETHQEQYYQYLYYIFMIPNYALTMKESLPHLGHYWSLGVEEQFYLFWPMLIAISKKPIVGIVSFIIFYVSFKVFLNLYYGGWSWQYGLFYLTRFDIMAVGGFFAYVYHKMPNLKDFLCNPFIHLMGWAGIIFSIPVPSLFDSLSLGCCVSIVLINQVSIIHYNPLRLEHKIFTFLGKISFGLYVYHSLVQAFIPPSWFKDLPIHYLLIFLLYFSIVMLLTILVSYISYRYLEMPFLKIKKKQMVIQSTTQQE